MTLITLQKDLDAFAARLRQNDIVFLDTEFMREKTYYPILCLIQAKLPGEDPVAIDALADTIEMAPLWEALTDPKILKVFHAGKQDLEIIVNATGDAPTPLFDTQIAASVLGYGEQAGFESLVRSILHHHLDKGSQFTDWSRRPLSDRQLKYALDDVRYLEPVYHHLKKALAEKGREGWVTEDMRALSDKRAYQPNPDEMWRRVKIRSDKPRELAVLRTLAAWREREAQTRDLPRGRVMKDEPMVEMAFHHPRTSDELMAIRGIDRGMVKGKAGEAILKAVADALALPDDACPRVAKRKPIGDHGEQLLDVLKLIVKIRARELGVVPRLLASSEDLDHLVREGFSGSALAKGWRYDVLWKDLSANPKFTFLIDLKGKNVTLSRV